MSAGHFGTRGPKIRYLTAEAAQAAVDRRHLEDINDHTGQPWRLAGIYRCKECAGWHFTSQSVILNRNIFGGGWARDHLLVDLELGTRVSYWLLRENLPKSAGRSPGRGITDRFRAAERRRRAVEAAA